MAIDATGTATTPDGIPTYNTAVDSPSGKGLNNIVAAIQTAFNSRPKTTTSVISGGPPVSPNDGDIWIATNVNGAGSRWQFQYNAGSASAFKWEFIGGAPIGATVTTQEAQTPINTWGDLATVGPSVFVPRAGDYDVSFSVRGQSPAGGAVQANVAVFLAAVDPGVNSHFSVELPAASVTHTVGGPIDPTLFVGLAANAELRVRYFSAVTATAYDRRTIVVSPIRIS